MKENVARRAYAGSVRSYVTLLLAVLILVPSLFGFGSKFIEFVSLVRGDVDGVFAITPVVNYLLASLGFLCLFCWAVLGGMFHDVEGPKHTMLETEARLDAAAARSLSPRHVRVGERVGGKSNDALLQQRGSDDVSRRRPLPSTREGRMEHDGQ